MNLADDVQMIYQVDRLLCRDLCSNLHSARCTGFYYNPNNKLCILGRIDIRTVEFLDTCPNSKRDVMYEYQRRNRCLSKYF